jgi:hypothetical protein
MDLHTNVGLGWKGLTNENSQAYQLKHHLTSLS